MPYLCAPTCPCLPASLSLPHVLSTRQPPIPSPAPFAPPFCSHTSPLRAGAANWQRAMLALRVSLVKELPADEQARVARAEHKGRLSGRQTYRRPPVGSTAWRPKSQHACIAHCEQHCIALHTHRKSHRSSTAVWSARKRRKRKACRRTRRSHTVAAGAVLYLVCSRAPVAPDGRIATHGPKAARHSGCPVHRASVWRTQRAR